MFAHTTYAFPQCVSITHNMFLFCNLFVTTCNMHACMHTMYVISIYMNGGQQVEFIHGFMYNTYNGNKNRNEDLAILPTKASKF